jgi:uncharacterized protein YndB with AHSA1/START domain
MNHQLVVEKSLFIGVDPAKVWQALIDPEAIKKFFFGTEAISDWVVGSTLVFRNEGDGKVYEDKGTILRADPGVCLEYSYWSRYSGLEDLIENYSKVTYDLIREDSGTTVKIIQKGFADEQSLAHADGGWTMVLKSLKELLEN